MQTNFEHRPSKMKPSKTPVEIKLLDSDAIAARRIPVEIAEVSDGKVGNWHCIYCDAKFVSEIRFMHHACEPKRRAQELASPVGQAAFGFYREWMRLRKYGQPGPAAFLESKFYRSFIKFAQQVQDANISRPDKYLWLMIEAQLQPSMWCSNVAYNLYTAWFDSQHDPMEQVQESISYLLDICERESVSLDKIFDHLGVQRTISLIRQRRLSPWFLFCSAKFAEVLKQIDSEQLKSFNSVINASYWSDKFANSKDIIEQIKFVIKELEL